MASQTHAPDQVEDAALDLIRRGTIDPTAGRTTTLRQLEEFLATHAEPGAAAPATVRDPREAARTLYDAVVGYGPLQPYFDDPTVEEIWVNEPGRVFVGRRAGPELTSTVLTDTDVRELVERMLKASGRRVDLSQPFVDAALPDGSRLHVVIPDVTRRHWAVNVRKFVLPAARLDDLVALGTFTGKAAAFLEAAVGAGLNILVSGGTQAGKTTLLSCLASAIPPRERVVTCEEVFELGAPLRDVVAMQTRQPSLEGTGEITLRRLVKEALRMRPDRLIVGEVRQAECLDLLVALNSGVPGMCSLHANSAREAVVKMCTLPLLAGDNVTHAFVVPTVAHSVDLVCHIGRDPDGVRRVREIVGVPGRVEGSTVEVADIFTTIGGRLVRADGWPPHADRFVAAGIDLATLLSDRDGGRP